MKPTVFNYQEYERVVEENKKLNAEVADLRIRIADKRDCKSCKHHKADGCSRWECEYEPRMVEVVRCKDCKHLGIKDLVYGYCKCRMIGIIMPDDYCSHGERREP